MHKTNEIKQFHTYHPWPDQEGIHSLFRFSKLDLNKIEYVMDFFVKGKLYHPLPRQFNDPFECKPHFIWPRNAAKVRAIRQHLIKVAKNDGLNKKTAKALISESMKKENLQKTIYEAIQKIYGELRICSFTRRKENLLFWSHYADSHKGFCVEFDATKLPISYAFKVRYTEEYPEVVYPRPSDVTAFIPALIKSKDWEYEEEYRTIFIPDAENQPSNDGESLILMGDEIINVYFGVNMDSKNKEKLLKIINNGLFKPGLWNAMLSRSAFKLEFTKFG